MHLFETEEGDKWVCITCGNEKNDMIEEKNGNLSLINMTRRYVVPYVGIQTTTMKISRSLFLS